MGYMLAGLSKTTEAGVAIAQVVNFPFMFLSGLFFPAEMLPSFLKPVMQVIPVTYLADALRQIMSGFTPMYPLWVDFTALGVFLVAFVGVSVKFFKWE
jgi:ABC-2 type transport system permease protein